MSDLDYDNLTQALQRAAIPADAAEMHGAITGHICLNGSQNAAWLELVAPDLIKAEAGGDALAGEARRMLESVYTQTIDQLTLGEFAFVPLLPDDNHELLDRATALGNWCQGFLLGLQQAGLNTARGLSTELAEVYKDFGEISQITTAELESSEDDEEAYAELHEYLKIGAILFFEEFHSAALHADNPANLH